MKKGKQTKQQKASMIVIASVLIVLIAGISLASIPLNEKNRQYKAQEKEIQKQIDEEKEKEAELDDMENYVGTDEYIADVAKDKLGLVNEGEILFEAEP